MGALERSVPEVGVDPVGLFVAALRAKYGHLALFLRDACGGSAVGVAWRPDAFIPQPFRVANVQSTLVLSEYDPPSANSSAAKRRRTEPQAHVLPNIADIIADFSVLGDGVVRSVELR